MLCLGQLIKSYYFYSLAWPHGGLHWFLSVKPVLRTWNKSYLDMVYNYTPYNILRCCWIWFANILLRVFTSKFGSDIGLHGIVFCFILFLVFVWFWYQGNTGFTVWLGSVPSSSIFCLLVFCWGFLHLCSLVILVCNFIFLWYLCLVLVSGWWWLCRTILGVFLPLQVFGRFWEGLVLALL